MTRYISAETTMEQNYRNDERMDEMAIEDCLANHGVERISSSFHPPIMEDATNGSTVLNNFIVSENDNDDLEEPVMEDRKSTRLNSSHRNTSRMPSSA